METREIKLFHNILKVKEQINFINTPHRAEVVTLIAVSKTKPVSDIELALQANQTVFGENYAQEVIEKFNHFEEGNRKPEFHFIGALQSNKVKQIIDKVTLIHSVDRLSLAKAIQKSAAKIDKIQDILVQVNLTGEETKSGVIKDQLRSFLEQLKQLPNVNVTGLMTMPFFDADPETVRPYFKELRVLKEQLNSDGFNLKELSMGMSHDYKVAIEEGATMVRVGSAIFGSR